MLAPLTGCGPGGMRLSLRFAVSAVAPHLRSCARWLLISAASSAALLAGVAACLDARPALLLPPPFEYFAPSYPGVEA